MARCKYGAIITEINGSIGGTTMQRNRYGFTIKQKPSQVRPSKIGQIQAQTRVSQTQSAWFSLTDSQRSSWNLYAASFPVATRLDSTAFLNGYNLFCKYHMIRFLSTTTILTDPAGAQQSCALVSTLISEFGGVLSQEYEWDTSGGDWYSTIYISRPIPQQSYNRQSRLRFLYDEASTNPSQNVTAAYNAIFGAVPVTGEFVILKCIIINQDNAQIFVSPPTITEVT